jgi:hypothetical protein
MRSSARLVALTLLFLLGGALPAHAATVKAAVGGHDLTFEIGAGWAGQVQQAEAGGEWLAAYAKGQLILYLTVMPKPNIALEKAVDLLLDRIPQQVPELTERGAPIDAGFNGYRAVGRELSGERKGTKLAGAAIACEAGPLFMLVILHGPATEMEVAGGKLFEELQTLKVDGKPGTAVARGTKGSTTADGAAARPLERTYPAAEAYSGGDRIEGAFFGKPRKQITDAENHIPMTSPQPTWFVFTSDGYVTNKRPGGWKVPAPKDGRSTMKLDAYTIEGKKLKTRAASGFERTSKFKQLGPNKIQIDGVTYERRDVPLEGVTLSGRFRAANDDLELKPSGEIKRTRSGESRTGRYAIEGTALTVTWDDGAKDSFDFHIDGTPKKPAAIYLGERRYAR